MKKISGEQLYRTAAWVGIGLGFLMIGYFLYMTLYPFNPLEVKEPVEVVDTEVVAGEKLHYTVDFCKNTDRPSTIQRYLSNHLDVQLDSVVVHRPPKCQEIDLELLIPADAPAGEYKIRHVAIYKYGFIREVTVRYDTEVFNVLPAEE